MKTGFSDVSGIDNFGPIRQIALALAMSALVAACAASHPAQLPPPPPIAAAPTPRPTPTPQVVGIASWYGPGFHGRKNAEGGIYHEDELTAASVAFPLGSRVMVTNLDNGRSVEVKITDRGPFKKGRKIDLSYKAAQMIGMLDKGTAHVRIALISKPRGTRDVGAPLRYWVQIGSFSDHRNAEQVRSELASTYPDVHLVDVLDADSHRYYRVRMGAFATRSAAETRASDSARFGLPVMIVTE
jgi:rare lipoprotein A